jgi:DNA-binding XRE family transcriptional regulator
MRKETHKYHKGDACMARPKREVDAQLEKEMQQTAASWCKFRDLNKLSQKFLSEIIGVSRRTIQSIEAGKIIPQAATVSKFEELVARYEAEGKRTGRRKSKKAA